MTSGDENQSYFFSSSPEYDRGIMQKEAQVKALELSSSEF